jgi:hypothetical protein
MELLRSMSMANLPGVTLAAVSPEPLCSTETPSSTQIRSTGPSSSRRDEGLYAKGNPTERSTSEERRADETSPGVFHRLPV